MHMNGINSQNWPQSHFQELVALAQHHGIPTRLLDWSSQPYVGAYFAAASAVSERMIEGDLVVFGFDFMNFYQAGGEAAIDLRPIDVPGSTSVNLSSQHGSFILVGNSGYRGTEFMAGVSLESKLPHDFKGLLAVTLPCEFAGELLSRCDRFGISAASVYPGYAGAATAALESALGNVHSRAGPTIAP